MSVIDKTVTTGALHDYLGELRVLADSLADSVFSESQKLRDSIDALLRKYQMIEELARTIDLDYIEANLHRLPKGGVA